jgi:hypothetical protein
MLLLAAGDTIAGVASAASLLSMTIFGMELNAGNEVYKALAQAQLPAAAATQYTAPASTTTFVRTISIVNTDAANQRTFQLFRGGVAAVNAITPVFTIPAGGIAMYEDGDGWQFFDNVGQLLQRQGGTTVPMSASLTANTANQTSTTEAVISQVLTVPANSMQPGSSFEVMLGFSAACGLVAQTTPGIVFNLRWGGLTGAILASTGIITPATSLAASAGSLRAWASVRTIGAAGSAMGSITVVDPRGTRAANGEKPTNTGFSAAPVTINTTVANDLVVTCKTTVADASAITFGTVGLSVQER